jgi:hypothetical protein
MLPPDYNGKTPDGYEALQPGTWGTYALFRSNLSSHSDDDVTKSVAYGKRVRIYPLFYMISIKDKDGESYEGGKTYRLTVPAHAPSSSTGRSLRTTARRMR